METVVDEIQDFFGEELGPDLIDQVSRAPHTVLNDLRERHSEFASDFRAPLSTQNHLRPYIPVPYLRAEVLLRGVKLRFVGSDFDSIEAAGKPAEALQQHLLYCHSVAVDNPLAGLLDWFFSINTPQTPWARARLVNYLIFLNYVKPLVQAGVLVLIEDNFDFQHDISRRYGTWPPRLVAYEEYPEIAKRADFSDLERFAAATLSGNAREEHIGAALACLSASLATSELHGDSLHLYFPFRYFRDAFREVVQRDASAAPGNFSETQLEVLDNLLDVSVPNLSSFSPQDIVAIRESEEAFEDWRTSLSIALEGVAKLDPKTLNRETEALSRIRQGMRAERRALDNKLNKSRLLSAAQSGARPFVVGALTALTLSPLESPEIPILSGAATGGYQFIHSYLTGGHKEHERALLRHFLLMEPEPISS